MKRKVIVMDSSDNVATAVVEVSVGEDVQVTIDSTSKTVRARDQIPFGHKIAIQSIEKGDFVRKYGEVIGRTTADIEVGEHVHIHNVESLRGRGDL